MIKYDKYSYIYPPRPEVKISPESLEKYDTGEYIVQPKFNGSNCENYLNETNSVIKNRHKGSLSNFKLKNEEISRLVSKNGWRVLVGEYMNKSKKNALGKVWNDKYVIFDILVNDGVHLVGTTYEERLKLLSKIFEYKEYDEYLNQITDNIFLIKSFEKDFLTMYNKIIKVDMLEGLVLKRKNGKLENSPTESANRKWQLKCRKPTKNYLF